MLVPVLMTDTVPVVPMLMPVLHVPVPWTLLPLLGLLFLSPLPSQGRRSLLLQCTSWKPPLRPPDRAQPLLDPLDRAEHSKEGTWSSFDAESFAPEPAAGHAPAAFCHDNDLHDRIKRPKAKAHLELYLFWTPSPPRPFDPVGTVIIPINQHSLL